MMEVFDGLIANVALEIRDAGSDYDHRPHLPSNLPNYYYTDEFRVGYACFKFIVAKVLQPKTIVEIGVGVGVSALAFLYGCPAASYIGIDNDCENGRNFPIKPSEFVKGLVGKRGTVIVTDSTKMDRLAPCDLAHVDGGHSYEDAFNDVMLAWRSNARWILVDDARDSVVDRAINSDKNPKTITAMIGKTKISKITS